MALRNYGVLRGRLVDDRREEGEDTPHYQLHVRAGGVDYRIAVNVESQTAPSELLFLVDETFEHAIVADLPGLPEGFTPLERRPGGLALDFIRANLFDRRDMRPLPPSVPGPDNDLADRLEHFARRARTEEGAEVYVFGERWGPETGTRDKVFGFSPGNGVHDIHMNQGNVGRFTKDDGVWQDGALVLHFPATRQWVGVFLAFQSQAWHTDDATGHTLPGVPRGPAHEPDPGEPDGDVRIAAARVNPPGGDAGHETVTLLNATARDVALAGWTLRNRAKQAFPLSGTLPGNGTLVVPLPDAFPLSNRGEVLTLVDAAGLKVHGVQYTARQARAEIVVF